MATERTSFVSREKARRILEEEYIVGQDYWLQFGEDGSEKLVDSDGEIVAVNHTTTSWTSPDYP